LIESQTQAARPKFKATSFSFNDFQIEGEAAFEDPYDLHSEYRSLKRDDPRLQGLLSQVAVSPSHKRKNPA
jgi:hypothetical protein